MTFSDLTFVLNEFELLDIRYSGERIVTTLYTSLFSGAILSAQVIEVSTYQLQGKTYIAIELE